MDNQTGSAGQPYRPPEITFVGHLVDLTLQVPKEVGAFDGTTYNTVQLGSVGAEG